MRVLWITCAALTVLAGCNSGAVGSPCSGGPLDEGVCVEGAVCTPERDPNEAPPAAPNGVPAYCRALCDSESDCPEPGFVCRVVPGSMARACQPVDSVSPADAGP
ncbi:MAG TPA: hypothetical protein VIL20_31420 [Sandaracinaceae bacterium]